MSQHFIPAKAGDFTVTLTVTDDGTPALTAKATVLINVVAAAPVVTAISPARGGTAGGTVVTITGRNFVTGATVTFGGAAATNVMVTFPSPITATTPAGQAGAADVVVTHPDGQAGRLANGFIDLSPPNARENLEERGELRLGMIEWRG